MFPPWPSQKILVLQHHNLKKLPLSMSQWISWGTIPKSDLWCILYQIVILLGENSWIWSNHGINRGFDPGVMLSLPTLHPKQRWKRSKGAATAPRNGSVGKLEKANKIIWIIMKKNHRTGSNMNKSSDTKKKSFFLVFVFFLAGMPRVGWVLFSHSLFRILQKRNVGRTYSIDRHARTENLSNRNVL